MADFFRIKKFAKSVNFYSKKENKWYESSQIYIMNLV